MSDIKLRFDKMRAIWNHRKMWNWIARECLKRKEVVEKEEYFRYSNKEEIYNYCFLCDYVFYLSNIENSNDCDMCPLIWNTRNHNDTCIDALYYDFCKCKRKKEHIKCAFYAIRIANLKERK